MENETTYNDGKLIGHISTDSGLEYYLIARAGRGAMATGQTYVFLQDQHSTVWQIKSSKYRGFINKRFVMKIQNEENIKRNIELTDIHFGDYEEISKHIAHACRLSQIPFGLPYSQELQWTPFSAN
jgi:hypothetical protein